MCFAWLARHPLITHLSPAVPRHAMHSDSGSGSASWLCRGRHHAQAAAGSPPAGCGLGAAVLEGLAARQPCPPLPLAPRHLQRTGPCDLPVSLACPWLAMRWCMGQKLTCCAHDCVAVAYSVVSLLHSREAADCWLPRTPPIPVANWTAFRRQLWMPKWWRRGNSTHSSTYDGQAPDPLLPELAQLQFLVELVVQHPTPISGRLPAEWGLPAAFPQLQR